MKILEWDVVKHGSGEPMNEIQSDSVAFAVNNVKRIVISYDEETDSLLVAKSGFNNDTITISPIASNRILIK